MDNMFKCDVTACNGRCFRFVVVCTFQIYYYLRMTKKAKSIITIEERKKEQKKYQHK